jgi:purine nucleoside permease
MTTITTLINNRLQSLALLILLTFSASIFAHDIEVKAIEVKVVVVTIFEFGEDIGDSPGEFQHWRERQGLTKKFAFPQSHHDIYMNEKTGVLGIVTGMGTARSSSAIMALGLDPRFDLTKAYWLVAGISGGDPADTALGSAVWAEYLVDGDFAHEIDAREIPADWDTGYFPLFSKGPYDSSRPSTQSEVFRLNHELAEWAYQTTKNVELADTDGIKESRKHYKNFPKSQQPPFVMKGDHLAGMTFWHGKLMNEWANKWVSYWSNGKGEFVTSAMEDTGSYQSLTYLTRAGKADVSRFMVLRTVSNFTVPPEGLSAAENLIKDGEDYSGMGAALESAYRVGSTVVNAIVDNWSEYKVATPISSKTKK